jgi:hypothetical protein
VFDVAVLVDALGSGVNHCASMTGAASSACLTLRVSVVTFSSSDVLVHMTHFAVVCIAVHHTLVPPVVQFDVVCACCQLAFE